MISEYTHADETIVAEETELYAKQTHGAFTAGTHAKVVEIYEWDGDTFVVLKFADAIGPDEIEIPADELCTGIGTKLVRREYNSSN